jgi:glutamate formiminotransferase
VAPKEECVRIVAVPNVSEGRDPEAIRSFASALEARGATVLDVHSDPVHNRSVLTVGGTEDAMPEAMGELAAGAARIDMTRHAGAHPRLGGLDVCPIVAEGISLDRAVEVARRTGETIATRARLPVYLYGAAATRPETRALPDLRKGGLRGLVDRAAAGLHPDLGPTAIDLRRGVVCVGARGPLIAFNVWIRADLRIARRIASEVRSSGGGPPGLRALAFAMAGDVTQVSLNLVEPARTGIDQAFAAVSRSATRYRASPEATEIVGLVAERYLPDPNGEAARLLMRPGRSLEAVWRELS